MKTLLSLAALLLGASFLPAPSLAEFRRFDGDIAAASNYIHYSEGYVVAPGYVDISDLSFAASADDDDVVGMPGENEDEREWNDDVSAGLVHGTSYVDIVLFHEPPSCANTYLGCDWTALGVGADDGVGNLRWCCSGDAVSLTLCDGGPKQEGRLIVDAHKFKGEHVVLAVPPSGKWEKSVMTGMFNLEKRGDGDVGTGKYVLVVANCNDRIGRNLTVSGQYVWKSSHGYLPGNLFGEMYFYSALIAVYVILFAFYAVKMSINGDSIILIQKWVLCTIGMGLLEVFFKAGDLWVWNVDGDRFWFSLYTGVIVGVLKRAISRVLVVMLSLGLGVTCDSLGGKMKKVVTLGIAYAGTSAARDVMTVLAITENEVLSTTAETELLDVVALLTLIAAFIDVTFYLWIFSALSGTMEYLQGMNQSRKLKRYLRLRMILLLSVLFAVVWTVFGIVDSYNDKRIINEEVNGWVLTAVWELNYLFVLVGLSCLWAPEAGAKEYAYVMELSTIGNDLQFDTNIDGPDSDDDEGGPSRSEGFSDGDDDDFVVNRGVKT